MTAKEFNLLLLIKNAKESIPLKSMKVTNILEEAVHQSDIVAKALAHHSSLGGEEKDAYVMSHDKDTQESFNHVRFGFEHIKGTKVSIRD